MYCQIQYQWNLQDLDIQISGANQIHSLNPHSSYKREGVRGSKKMEYVLEFEMFLHKFWDKLKWGGVHL